MAAAVCGSGIFKELRDAIGWGDVRAIAQGGGWRDESRRVESHGAWCLAVPPAGCRGQARRRHGKSSTG